MSEYIDLLSGWKEDRTEVSRIQTMLPQPLFMGGAPAGNDPVCLYDIYRQIAGEDDLGVQQIGDCVSWGTKHLNDYVQAIEIYHEINDLSKTLQGMELKAATDAKLYEFEMSSSEVIYALARVQVGGQHSRSDGAVGAWAAKALHDFGSLSYKALKIAGLSDVYSGQRAKSWGYSGLPSELLPVAKTHLIATTSLVTNFNDAAHLIENGYGIAVCSNVGFENGPGRITQRDSQGFATPRGTWNHCMFLSAVRYDRPGCCVINQWPLQAFTGPLSLNQPKNSFWVDQKWIDQMLGQQDSWTASGFTGYPIRPMTYRF